MADTLKIVEKLNADVVAGDVLREAYRYQMDEHARLARYANDLRNDLEQVEARQRTAAERATSIMETLARYGGMLAPEDTALARARGEQRG